MISHMPPRNQHFSTLSALTAETMRLCPSPIGQTRWLSANYWAFDAGHTDCIAVLSMIIPTFKEFLSFQQLICTKPCRQSRLQMNEQTTTCSESLFTFMFSDATLCHNRVLWETQATQGNLLHHNTSKQKWMKPPACHDEYSITSA